MVQKKFPKAVQGRRFRVEVAHVSPTQVVEPPAKVGEPITLACDVLGFKKGKPVEFKIYEPHKLHEAPLETLQGETQKEERGVSVEWTLDYEAKKDDLDGTAFVVVAKCGKFLSISEPFPVVTEFKSTVKDAEGKPLPNTAVTLWSSRGENVPAETDEEGKLDLLVAPGVYRVEVGEAIEPEKPQAAGTSDEDEVPGDADLRGSLFKEEAARG